MTTNTSGVRTYYLTLQDGIELLIVGIVVNGEEIARLPGPLVACVRALLQRVEQEYPALVGSDEGIERVEKQEVLRGTAIPADKTKLN